MANDLIPRQTTPGRSTSWPERQSSTTSAKAVAVILKPLIDLHGKPPNWETSSAIYVEALADLPPDLLATAVQQCIRTCRFFPKPAELRNAIADELAERLDAFNRRIAERRVALPAPEPPGPRSAEDIAHVERVLAPLRTAIRSRRRVFSGLPPLPPEPLPSFHLLDADDPRVTAAMNG